MTISSKSQPFINGLACSFMALVLCGCPEDTKAPAKKSSGGTRLNESSKDSPTASQPREKKSPAQKSDTADKVLDNERGLETNRDSPERN